MLVGWIQNLSNLVLNLNGAVGDVRTGRVVAMHSVDMHGDTDACCSRAASRLAREMSEQLESNSAD